jgi:hypothetical protein
VSFTPDEVDVRVEGAQAGDHLVLNQNWDPGWTANGVPSVALKDAVSTVLPAGASSVAFRYRPPLFGLGLGTCALTLAGIGILAMRGRRGKGAAS